MLNGRFILWNVIKCGLWYASFMLIINHYSKKSNKWKGYHRYFLVFCFYILFLSRSRPWLTISVTCITTMRWHFCVTTNVHSKTTNIKPTIQKSKWCTKWNGSIPILTPWNDKQVIHSTMIQVYIYVIAINLLQTMICSVWRNHNLVLPHSCLTTGFTAIVTQRVTLVQQELITLPEHLWRSPLVLVAFLLLKL